MSGESKVVLISGDDEMFEVDQSVALEWTTLMNMVADKGNNRALNLPDISGEVLAKIIKYCEYHVESRKKTSDGEPTVSTTEITRWDADFVKIDQKFLYDLITAAYSLDIKNLLNLLTTTVANLIRDYSPEEIRTIFGIKDDFTEAERQEVNRMISRI